MEDQDLMKTALIRASGAKKDTIYSMTKAQQEKRCLNGAKRIKRGLLGLCGKESVKNLDEIASVLHNLGATETIEEARKIVPLMNELYYGEYSGITNRIPVLRITPEKGSLNYRVSAHYETISYLGP